MTLSVYITKFLQDETASIRVLCLPFAGGETRSLADDWVRACRTKMHRVEIFGVDWTWNSESVSVEEWADQVIRALCGQFFDKQYVVFGHSLGGLAVVALTKCLQQHKIALPAHIFLSAVMTPDQAKIYDTVAIYDEATKLKLLESWCGTDRDILDCPDRRTRVLEQLTGDLMLHNRLVKWLDLQNKPIDFGIDVPVTLYSGCDDPVIDSVALGSWNQYFPATEIQVFPGDHFYLMHNDTQSPFLLSFLSALDNIHARLVLNSRSLIDQWNNRTAPYPSDKCLHDLFKEAVQRTPSATAVYYNDKTLTFEQLDFQSDQVAAYLYSVGVRPNTITGIFMEHCIEFVIAYIGALKAGGAYMPLEIVYPPDLLSRVLQESKPIIILTKQNFRHRLPSWQLTLEMDAMESFLESIIPLPDDRVRTNPDDLAYVVMSSGTTGIPKGICCPHRGAVHSYDWRLTHTPYLPHDRVACHVFFVWELLRPLLGNITLYIIPDDVIYDPHRLVEYMAQNHITRILFTPSLLQLILDTVPNDILQGAWSRSLRLVWLCGEVVTMELQERFVMLFPQCALYNLYSVSECHDVSAIDLAKDRSMTRRKYASCGQVMPNVKAFILNDAHEPVPFGVPGELYIGGPCLAIGYLNRPEQTAQRFLTLPTTQERVYKTGDRARFLPNGDLELIGRCDFMVKIRGYSVVLGAVETALSQHALVSTAVVLAEGNEGDDKRLVAYIVPNQWDQVPSVATLRTFLQEKLPFYAIPSVFHQLDALPIHSASGKLDRKQITSQQGRKLRAFSIEWDENELETETEHVLAQIWKDLLRLDENDRVTRTSHFFDMGGHSLLATRLISRIMEEFHGTHVTLADVLSSPILHEIATRIDSQMNGIETMNQVSLPLEVVLDPSIYPAATRKAGYSRYRVEMVSKPPRTIFLTGCTGFLGIHLVASLLNETDVIVYCLVRAATEQDGWVRIRQALKQYHLVMKNDLWEDHIVVILGDLSQPLLGVNQETFQMLASEVDAIIHNGAEVHLMKPYTALKAVNVLGTQEVLRLAVTNGLMKTRVKPVHYISTNGVFPSHYAGSTYLEGADLTDCWRTLENGYAQSKWVAEQLCRQAAQRGLPVSILRPGNMAPSSLTGCWNRSDFIYLFLCGCKELKAIPLVEDWQFDLTPVDFAAQAIVSLTALHPVHALGETLHIQNPHPPIPGNQFLNQWRQTMIDCEIVVVTLDEWKQTLFKTVRTTTDKSEINKLAAAFTMFEGYLKTDKVFDCTQATTVLQIIGLHCPVVNQELLKVYHI